MVECVPSAAYVENMFNTEFDASVHLFDAEHIEKNSILEMLIALIGSIDDEMSTVGTHLGTCANETHETVTEILKFAQAFQTLKAHFQFVLDVLNSKSDSEIAEIKDKLTTIREKYEKINSIEDVAVIPTKYVLMLTYSKVIPLLRRVASDCFKYAKNGEVEIETSQAHIQRVRIAAHRADICNTHFATVVTLPRDDIFRLEKTSPLWQDLYKNVVFKKINSYDDTLHSFKLIHFTLMVGFATLNTRSIKKPTSSVQKYVDLVKDTLYYGVDSDRLESDANHFLINPPLEEAFKVWNIPENFIVSKFLAARLPFVGHDEQIFVPRLFPAITKEQILSEYADGTINKICPTPFPTIDSEFADRYNNVDELLVKDSSKVAVRVMASEALNYKKERSLFGGLIQSAFDVVKGCNSTNDEAIVIHIHGGGFVSLSSSSHRSYLLNWAKNLKLVHFSIDYRLAPEHTYTETLDDVWQAYNWIMNYAQSSLGIKTQKVILIGDSAGANLIFALTLRLIRAGLKTPDGLVLLYPTLSMDIKNFSPSYFLSLDDRMLPYSLMNLVIKAHVGDGIDGIKDPFVSPLAASDELMSKLPPVRIVSGSNDPLHDENWRLLHRLTGLKKEVKFVVHENLSHAYLSNQDLKNYDTYCDEACDLIRELIAL